ncbi:C2 domain-containing protein [Dichotomocladium elegans]|nr:C2 domain-containing protein [Dichotomocladium elegans]
MLSSVSAPRGVLTVRIIEGAKLEGEDTFGTNDPYVELWLDEDYKQRTEVLKDTTNPVWDQTFTFNIEEGYSKHKLYLKVLDKDLMDEEKIGKGHIDIETAYNGNEIDDWVDLPAHLGLSSHGKIHVVITFTPQ